MLLIDDFVLLIFVDTESILKSILDIVLFSFSSESFILSNFAFKDVRIIVSIGSTSFCRS